MMKRSQSNVVVTIEWNAEGGRLENLPEEDFLSLARALGRLAARRDLARMQKDRAQSQPCSKVDAQPNDAEQPVSKTKALSVTE